jgi:hypothetical protein
LPRRSLSFSSDGNLLNELAACRGDRSSRPSETGTAKSNAQPKRCGEWPFWGSAIAVVGCSVVGFGVVVPRVSASSFDACRVQGSPEGIVMANSAVSSAPADSKDCRKRPRRMARAGTSGILTLVRTCWSRTFAATSYRLSGSAALRRRTRGHGRPRDLKDARLSEVFPVGLQRP